MPFRPRRAIRRLTRRILAWIWPNQRLRWTREGVLYFFVWLGLLVIGMYQQINLILLVSGLAAGPLVASVFVSASLVRRLKVIRRLPPYVFAGEPLAIDYTLTNERAWTAALAMTVEDELLPVERGTAGVTTIPRPRVFFARVAGRGRGRLRWEAMAPSRGRYRFPSLELITRSPFGLLERRVTLDEPDELIVYPEVGELTRRWHTIHRETSETRRGRRHDRSLQQQEYHGLRDYRPGDSPRWIHWRTSARVGEPMVKEFEVQHDQDLAILLDPWLPRIKATSDQREAVEQAIRFAATVCLETCRHRGRRLLLGWTGPTPGLGQGPASVKLLHELLGQLAVLRPSAEGTLAPLLDAMPPAMLREAMLVIIGTRPIQLAEEAERSSRLAGPSSRGLLARATLIDVSRGDLDELFRRGNAALGHRGTVDSRRLTNPEPSSSVSSASLKSVPAARPREAVR